ncbi:helix-turn-helix transcriptional regulator [Bacillus sp. Gen3]|uniref:helix-turn-helix domain-containing protein n=1 Tax=Heyndrickxia oleronia TaxID=38875 RepID=UPI0015D24FD2|nr:helix-turn-helix transcriptional regulator [Bacillus sp. Gen3]
MSILAKRIKYLREKKEYSQKKVAESLGITNVQLSRYESGDRKPDPELIAQIADFYDVSTDYLHGRTDDPIPPKENKTSSDQKEGAENFFYFDLEGLNEEEKDLLHASYNAMRERARKRAAAKKKDEEK